MFPAAVLWMGGPVFDRRELKILLGMVIVNFCLVVDFMIVMPQGPQLMRAFPISAREFSWLVSGYTLGAGLMGAIASLFIDRFDRKKGLLIFFAGFALANLLCALAPSYWTFVLARFITGSMGGVTGTMIFAIVSDSVDPKKRSTAFGVIFSAFALASIIGVPLCLYLANHVSWQAPFVAIFAFTGLVAAYLLATLPRMSAHLDKSATFARSLRELKELALEKGRLAALVFTALLILGHFSINPFLFVALIQNAELPETSLPIVYVVVGIASVLSSIVFGYLSDTYGRKKVFALSLIASLLAIYGVTHLRPAPLFELTGIVTAFMVVMGGRLAPAMTIVSEAASAHNRGRFLSLVGSVQQLSTAAAAAMAGAIVVKTDQGKILHFGTVGAVAIVLSVIALFVGLRLRSLPQEFVAEGESVPQGTTA